MPWAGVGWPGNECVTGGQALMPPANGWPLQVGSTVAFPLDRFLILLLSWSWFRRKDLTATQHPEPEPLAGSWYGPMQSCVAIEQAGPIEIWAECVVYHRGFLNQGENQNP